MRGTRLSIVECDCEYKKTKCKQTASLKKASINRLLQIAMKIFSCVFIQRRLGITDKFRTDKTFKKDLQD